MARKERLITPFASARTRKGVISYGVSSYGYDFRLADEFQALADLTSGEIDPKRMKRESFASHKTKSILIPPNSFLLGRSVEYFRIPRDVLTICLGKSTYARCGVVVNVTPFEPEWEGFATISLANTTPLPVRVYANEGIAQVIFLQACEQCRSSYADKKGKYQAQKEITRAKI
jgi:dCTP deaminase